MEEDDFEESGIPHYKPGNFKTERGQQGLQLFEHLAQSNGMR